MYVTYGELIQFTIMIAYIAMLVIAIRKKKPLGSTITICGYINNLKGEPLSASLSCLL